MPARAPPTDFSATDFSAGALPSPQSECQASPPLKEIATMSTEPKGPEPKVRDRISFQEVAKLAETPEAQPSSTEEKKENSGMIDLAALAASDTNPDAARELAPKTDPSAA